MRRRRSLENSLVVSASALIGIVMETAATTVVIVRFNVIIQIKTTAGMVLRGGRKLIFISHLFMKKLNITFSNHILSHTEDYVENVNASIVTIH